MVNLLAAGAGLTVTLVGAFPVLVLTLRLARALGSVHRRLAGRLLGWQFASPPPFRPGRGVLGRLDARLRDGDGWRAVAYVALKLPLSALGIYAALYWVSGLVNLTSPLWWALFRNHRQGGRLGSVLVITPLPGLDFRVATWPGTLAALVMGAATLLAAPWVTRAVTAGDRRLIRNLLGPARLAQRVQELERSRALAVDDAAAALRQVSGICTTAPRSGSPPWPWAWAWPGRSSATTGSRLMTRRWPGSATWWIARTAAPRRP